MTKTVPWSFLRPVTMLATVSTLVGTSPAAADQRSRPAESIVFGPKDTPRCLKCHGMANFAFQDSVSAPLHNYTVNQDSFQRSVHGRLDCQQCHGEIRQYPHQLQEPRLPVSCAASCHATDSTGKAFTHEGVVKDFQASIHRAGRPDQPKDNPTCVTCHGAGNPHGIVDPRRPRDAVARMNLCIDCHADTARMSRHGVDPEAGASYQRSFHYKAIRFGLSNTAVCQDCHTVHRVLPKDSATSSIATGQIARTCGQKQCHPGAQMSFAMSGANHLSLRIEREPILWWLEKFFLVLTGGTMAMLFVGIALDVQRSFGWGRLVGRMLGRLRTGWRRVNAGLPRWWQVARRVLID